MESMLGSIAAKLCVPKCAIEQSDNKRVQLLQINYNKCRFYSVLQIFA